MDNTGYLSQSAYTLSGKHEPLSHAEISKSLESTKELNKQEVRHAFTPLLRGSHIFSEFAGFERVNTSVVLWQKSAQK